MQSETSLPDFVKNAVFQKIERRADVDPNTLKVIRTEYRVWSDSCFGIQKPGVLCLQVLTPGWIVEVEGKNQLPERPPRNQSRNSDVTTHFDATVRYWAASHHMGTSTI